MEIGLLKITLIWSELWYCITFNGILSLRLEKRIYYLQYIRQLIAKIMRNPIKAQFVDLAFNYYIIFHNLIKRRIL